MQDFPGWHVLFVRISWDDKCHGSVVYFPSIKPNLQQLFTLSPTHTGGGAWIDRAGQYAPSAVP